MRRATQVIVTTVSIEARIRYRTAFVIERSMPPSLIFTHGSSLKSFCG